MALTQVIGIIGGAGWLGGALAKAAVAAGVVDQKKLILSSRSGPGAAEVIGCQWTKDNAELVAKSDAVILSVRPQQFGDLDFDLRDKLVISVMAGISSVDIARRTKATRIVRAMPNAAAAVGRSFTPWFASKDVTDADKDLVLKFFGASGDAAPAAEESYIDYCGALTGTGAAYPALLAEALIAHAVKHGVNTDFARRAVKSVVSGASQLFAGPEGDTASIVKEMIDYRGLTAAALQTMLDKGFNEVVAAGLDAGIEKGKSLGK